ncbi:MAG: pentapeptide repeat-containing protein, partial [Cyanobacteria bacterium P01_H01_bin.162]
LFSHFKEIYLLLLVRSRWFHKNRIISLSLVAFCVFYLALLFPRVLPYNDNVAATRDRDLSNQSLQNSDFSSANLKGVDFTNSNLGGADLEQVDGRESILINTNLFSANLSEANLSGSILYAANLSHANLFNANLKKADLREADLRKANLFRADLAEAKLSEESLTEAKICRTRLPQDLEIDSNRDCKDKHSWKVEF